MAVVFSCAAEYKENLVDHSLLFLCQANMVGYYNENQLQL